VILAQPLYIGVHEVTQQEYAAVMGSNPSYFAGTGPDTDLVEKLAGLNTANHPVEGVSSYDAAEFCTRLSQREDLKPFYLRAGDSITFLDGTGYRLPVETEWEFACRAGTSTRFWVGDQADDLVRAAWLETNSGARTHPVGERGPIPGQNWPSPGTRSATSRPSTGCSRLARPRRPASATCTRPLRIGNGRLPDTAKP
jgi:formylglycine-generating enzyme required for sulfatase activity